MMELLSPAGGLKSFYASLNAGADAIYLGLRDFSARASAENFSWEELQEAISYAKPFGVKIYVTVNTLLKDGELRRAEEAIVKAHNMGVDGFIVQDFFFGKKMKEFYPEITFHLSTQAGVCNVFYAKMAKESGYSRVVLSRELPLSEIAAISAVIETEVFVQGALCTCFSGHCYFSSFVGGNSGNRGRCKQPCRKTYYFLGEKFRTQPSYAVSLSDLNVGEDIQKLVQAGVSSFKIEGRMRREEYAAAATGYYRRLLDGEPASPEALYRVYNRGDYTKGYLFGQDKKLVSSQIQNHKGLKIGTVAELRGRKILVRSRHIPEIGDGFKILSSGKEVGGAAYQKEDVTPFGFYLTGSGTVMPGDSVHITTDVALKKELLSQKRLLPVEINGTLTAEKAEITLSCGETVVSVESKEVAPAKTAPLTKQDVAEQLQKTADLPVDVLRCKVKVGSDLFMTKGGLNSLRRTAYERLFAALKARFSVTLVEDRSAFFSVDKPHFPSDTEKKTAVIADDFSFPLTHFTELIFAPTDYADRGEIDEFFNQTAESNAEKYLYLPPYFTEEDAKVIYPYIKRFDGIFSESLFGLEFAKRLKTEVFLGEECNLFNAENVSAVASLGVEKISISKELAQKEMTKEMLGSCYVPALGSVKLMQLCYCPFGKNCANCKTPDRFEMCDEEGRVFPVRRYRLNGCRFEVFNSAMLLTKEPFRCRLVNLLGVDKNRRRRIAENLFDTEKLKNIMENTSTGHLFRGVE